MTKLPDAESLASSLLKDSDQQVPPVSLDRVVSKWPGLRVTYETLEREGYLVDLGTLGGEIIVKQDDILPRKRYTIAHEIGHWALRQRGRQGGSPDMFSCSEHMRAPVEKWCDHFAAALLMPRSWILSALRWAGPKGLVKKVISAPSAYQVSHEAFRLRVSTLTPISIVELRRNGAALTVAERYEGQDIIGARLAGTVKRALKRIVEDPTISADFDDQNYLSMGIGTWPSDQGVWRWLVCIYPASWFSDQDQTCAAPDQRPRIDDYPRLRVLAARRRQEAGRNGRA